MFMMTCLFFGGVKKPFYLHVLKMGRTAAVRLHLLNNRCRLFKGLAMLVGNERLVKLLLNFFIVGLGTLKPCLKTVAYFCHIRCRRI